MGAQRSNISSVFSHELVLTLYVDAPISRLFHVATELIWSLKSRIIQDKELFGAQLPVFDRHVMAVALVMRE